MLMHLVEIEGEIKKGTEEGYPFLMDSLCGSTVSLDETSTLEILNQLLADCEQYLESLNVISVSCFHKMAFIQFFQ